MEVPELIVLQRVRNRVFEYIELVALAEADVPMLKTSDIVNIWEDYVSMPDPDFEVPPYSESEVTALKAFADAWEAFCFATPDWPETYSSLFAHRAWPAFRDAAARALAVFRVRGMLPED